MICKNCGKEIDDDSLFCEHCGSKLVKKKGKKATKIILGIISVMVIIVIAFTSRFFLFKIASDKIDDMVNNLSFIDSLSLYDDSIEVNITDNFSTLSVLRFTECFILSEIYADSDSHIIYNDFYNSNSVIHFDTDVDFEEGKTYEIMVNINVHPLGYTDFFYKIDHFLARNGILPCTYAVRVDSYFMYKNGEFIKVNQ